MSTTTRNIWDALEDVNSTVDGKITETNVIIKSPNSVVGDDDTCTVGEVQREDSYKQILKISTRDPASWSRGQKIRGPSVTNETRPLTSSSTMPSLSTMKKKLHLSGGVVKSHEINRQHPLTTPPATRIASLRSEDILAKLCGILKGVPAGRVLQPKQQRDADSAGPSSVGIGENQISVKHADETAKAVCTPRARENDVTIGDKSDDQAGSEDLSCRLLVPVLDDPSNTITDATVGAADLKKDYSLRVVNRHHLGITGIDSRNKSVRKTRRKRSSAKVNFGIDDDANNSLSKRSDCPVVAVTPCRPVDKSPEKMHPEIVGRLRTDLRVSKPDVPIVISPFVASVVLDNEEKPLDLSTVVSPTTLPLDLSTNGTDREAVMPDRTVGTVTFKIIHPNSPLFSTRVLPQNVSPVKPVQRYPVSRAACSERLDATADAQFRDGAGLHKVMSQRVRTAVDKLQFSKVCDQHDTPTQLCPNSVDESADSPCVRSATGMSNDNITTHCADVADTTETQRISRIASMLAQRLCCSVSRAATPRSSYSNGPSPNTSPPVNAASGSDGTLQFRFTAPRRNARKLNPPLAQVKPITICSRPRTPNTSLSETASVEWTGAQLRPSGNIGLSTVEPSKDSVHTVCSEQISQRQAPLKGQSGKPIYSETPHVSASSPVVAQEASHTSPTLDLDTLTIVDMDPVMITNQMLSSCHGVDCKSVSKPCNISQTVPTLSSPSAVEKSQKRPSLSPPKLHIVGTPSVARNDVCKMSATSQMPELSPHADEPSVNASDSCSHDSGSVSVRKSMTAPTLLVHEAGDGYSPAVKRRRTVRHDGLKLSMSDPKSSTITGVSDAGASHPKFDLSVFMPTKSFSMDFFSSCTDTWAEDIACPSRAVGSIRHRSTFDIGRTNYYKNAILCQQIPATTRPGGRNPLTPTSRGARRYDARETSCQYHRDCRLPASIIAALPTLPARDDHSSPKLARTVAGVKRAMMASRDAANASSTPPKIACAGAKKMLLSSDKHVQPNASPKMARTVASVKQALRDGLHMSKPTSGLARKDSVRSSQLSIGIPGHNADCDPLSHTGYDLSDPENSFLSPRYGYARKAFATHSEPSMDASQIGEASNRLSRHVTAPCRNEPVVNKLASSKDKSVKRSPRRSSCEKPKNDTLTKQVCTKRLASPSLLTHAEFPQLDAYAVDKATMALTPIVKREPGLCDHASAKECSSSLSDHRQQLSSSDRPLSCVETTTRDDPCHSGSASSNDANERTPAVAGTVSKIKLRHSYPIVKLERVESGPDQEVTWKCVSESSSVSGVERRASNRRQSRCRSESKSVTSPVSSQASNVSGDVPVRSRRRMPRMVRRILPPSPRSSSSGGSQHRKRRSLLDQLSNTHGYIADETRGRSNDDLFADPSTLSREERALQRAMIKFTEMEVQAEGSAKGADGAQTKLSGDEKRRSSDRKNSEYVGRTAIVPVAPIARSLYLDFVPDILNCRTRYQGLAIGSCTRKRYHKDWAYEMELYRERQRRQRIRDQRQARLLSNQSVQESPLSSTAERRESASPAKRKRNAFTWSSPYWKGSRSQSLRKKLYGRRMKIVKLTGGKKHVDGSTTKLGSVPIPADVKKLVVNREAGETVLHRAARLGYNEVALWCCQTGHVDVNAQDHAGFTPLHETCIGGHVAIAKTLLAYGADINVASRMDGVRPIHDAVQHDQIEMVRILLSCGADTSLTYSSRSLLAIAHSDEMKQFLHGYFADLNGPKKQQLALNSSWEFVPYNCIKQEPGDELEVEEEETGCDLFDHIPSDEASSAGDLQLELSDRPHLSTYNLTFSPVEGPRNYILLHDVLDHLNIDRACLMKSLGRGFQTKTLSMADFLYRTQHCQNLVFRYNDDASSHVELLELKEALRCRFDVECVTFRNGVLLDGDGEKLTGVVQPDTSCPSRSMQPPLQVECLVGAPLSPAPASMELVAAITPEEMADSISGEFNFDELDEMALMQRGYRGNTNADITRCEGEKRHPATTSVDDRLSDLFCPVTRVRIGRGQVRVLRDTNGRRLTPCVARSLAVPELIATADAAGSFDLNGWGCRNSAVFVAPTAVSPNKVTRVICASTGRRLDVGSTGSQPVNTHKGSSLLADRYQHYRDQSLPLAGVSLGCSETDSASEGDGECMIKIANVCTLRGSKAMKLFAPDSPSYAASLPP